MPAGALSYQREVTHPGIISLLLPYPARFVGDHGSKCYPVGDYSVPPLEASSPPKSTGPHSETALAAFGIVNPIPTLILR